MIDQPAASAAVETFEFEPANPWDQADRPWRAPELSDTQSVEAATAAGVGQYTSIAVDSNRRPHISYYDVDNKDLKYARWTGSVWDIDRVNSTGSVGKYSSLALDNDNDPYIAYYNDSIDGLRFASRSSGSWDKETVEQYSEESGLYPGAYTSLAVSSSGKPYISYYEYDINLDEGYLKYATLTSGSWVKEYVDKDADDDVGWYTSIALNSDANPGISYYDGERQNLKYARRSGGSWSRETVASSDNTGLYTSLVYDGNNPRISYYDAHQWCNQLCGLEQFTLEFHPCGILPRSRPLHFPGGGWRRRSPHQLLQRQHRRPQAGVLGRPLLADRRAGSQRCRLLQLPGFERCRGAARSPTTAPIAVTCGISMNLGEQTSLSRSILAAM